jgi:regulator of nucleoside diphosphate kinase
MAHASCRLTTKDFAILEVMLERRRPFGDPIVPLLEDKLARASVVLIDSIEADVVTLNSRVSFRVDGGPVETRTLVQSEVRGPVGSSLSIGTLRGLCMIGLSEGSRAVIELPQGRREVILVEKILYQPEAARRIASEKPRAAAQSRPALTLVYSAPDDGRPLGERRKIRQTGDDDPGPSAA